MAIDYSKVQTYYEIIVNFKHGTKSYKLKTRDEVDNFINNARNFEEIISYQIARVQKTIYNYR